jgi:hypothetical protein
MIAGVSLCSFRGYGRRPGKVRKRAITGLRGRRSGNYRVERNHSLVTPACYLSLAADRLSWPSNGFLVRARLPTILFDRGGSSLAPALFPLAIAAPAIPTTDATGFCRCGGSPEVLGSGREF